MEIGRVKSSRKEEGKETTRRGDDLEMSLEEQKAEQQCVGTCACMCMYIIGWRTKTITKAPSPPQIDVK